MITFHRMDAVDMTTRMRFSGHTVAKFTRNDSENGEPVLESTLQINTSVWDPSILNLRNASVTCIEGNQNNRSRSIEFQVVGKDV